MHDLKEHFTAMVQADLDDIELELKQNLKDLQLKFENLRGYL